MYLLLLLLARRKQSHLTNTETSGQLANSTRSLAGSLARLPFELDPGVSGGGGGGSDRPEEEEGGEEKEHHQQAQSLLEDADIREVKCMTAPVAALAACSSSN